MATRAPRVSILLPAFQAEATLGACLRSVCRQTAGDWECIVVDDGSTDATAAIVREFARIDGRVRLLSTAHRGLVAALNTGLGSCRGAYVARMDADDIMARRRIAEQVALLDGQPGWSGAGCHVRLFPRRGIGPGTRAYEAWLDSIDSPAAVRREAFVECPIAHPTLVLRREALAREGYRDCGRPEDYDLVLRLLCAGHELGVLPQRRLLWRRSAQRLSRTAPAYAIERFTACKATFLARSFLAASERYVLWGYGSTGRGLRRALALLGKRPASIVEIHPGRIGNRIHGAPVLTAESLRDLPRLPLVVSVAGIRARTEIRAALAAWSFRETVDYVCAA